MESSARSIGSFNRDSKEIPESRRMPNLSGISEEERVAVDRDAIPSRSWLSGPDFDSSQITERRGISQRVRTAEEAKRLTEKQRDRKMTDARATHEGRT
jgi:hypothetical protein